MQLILWNLATPVDFECYQDDNGDYASVTELASIRATVARDLASAQTAALNDFLTGYIEENDDEDGDATIASIRLGYYNWEPVGKDGFGDDTYHLTLTDPEVLAVLIVRVIEIPN